MKKKILSLGIVTILIAMLILLTGCGEQKTDTAGIGNQESEMLYPHKDSETGLYGYINSKGEYKIEPKWDLACGFDTEMTMARVVVKEESSHKKRDILIKMVTIF